MTAHERLEIPDLILEQYRLNELPPQEAHRVEQQLRESATLQQRLDALDRSDAELARQYPPAWMAERIRERLSRGPRIPEGPERSGSPLGDSGRSQRRGGHPRRRAAPPWRRADRLESRRAGDRDRSHQGTAAGAGGLSTLRSGQRNARGWRHRPPGGSPSTRIHGRRTCLRCHRVDRRARGGHAPSASERGARGIARSRESRAPRQRLRARRRAELGTVLFRHGRHRVRGRADRRGGAPCRGPRPALAARGA